VILVTGHAGLIGTELCKQLGQHGITTRGYDLKTGQDVLDVPTLREAMRGCWAVVHLAAVSRVIDAENDQVKAYRTNVEGTRNVAVLALKSNTRVILASSREVYGNTEVAAHEHDRHKPESFYGETKSYAEESLRSAGDLGLDFTILRFSNVYGGANDHPTRVVPAFMRAALNGETAKLEGSGFFDFVHVEDAARAVRCALKIEPVEIPAPVRQTRAAQLRIVTETGRRAYNIVTGTSTSLQELARRCEEATGMPLKTRVANPRYFGARRFHGSTALAARELGWTAQIPLADGLARYARVLRMR